MKTKIGIIASAVVLLLAGISAAETPPVSVSAQSDSCFNQTGTIPLTCDIGCVSSQPCEDYHVSVCSNAQIDEGIAGSANSLPGGTFEKTTCTEPTMPFGGSFTATGTWSGTNSVFFACVPSSLTGSNATFLIAASDKTGQAATTTLTVPVCTTSGPQLTVQKNLGTVGLVNGHTRVGAAVDFTVTVTNVGTAAADSFTVIDGPLEGLNPIFASAGGPRCTASGYVQCDVPGLPPGGKITIVMEFDVTKAGDIVNTADVYPHSGEKITSNSVTVEAKGPRPNPVREGLPPLRPLSGK